MAVASVHLLDAFDFLSGPGPLCFPGEVPVVTGSGISSLTMNQESGTIPVIPPVFEERRCQQDQDKLYTKIERDFAG